MASPVVASDTPESLSYSQTAVAPPLHTTPKPGKTFADAIDNPDPHPESNLDSSGSVRLKRDDEMPTQPPAPEKEKKERKERRHKKPELGDKPGDGTVEGGQLMADALKKPKKKKQDHAENGDHAKKPDGIEKRVEKHRDVHEDGVKTPEKTGEQAVSNNEEDIKSEKSKEMVELDEPVRFDVPSLVSALPRGPTWAPLNVPLPRRLQTTAVLWHSLSMATFLSFFWFMLAIPFTWPILLPYLVYVLFSDAHADGSAPYRRSKFMRSLPIWQLYAEYFPLRLHRTAELDPKKNYIFAFHPHGILSHSAFGNFATEATEFSTLFPGIKNTLLTLESNFRVPFYREYLLGMGVASVDRRSCEALLRGTGAPRRSLWNPTTWTLPRDPRPTEGGRAITIVIGGARESLDALPGTTRLVVKRRLGFLKLALAEGAAVVPVLSFGENDLYDQVVPDEKSVLHRFQMSLKSLAGFTIPLAHARGVFNYDVGLMPYRKTVNTVVGRPVYPDDGNDDIKVFQQKYMDELQHMWDEWKEKFAKDRLPGQAGEMTFIE